MKLIVGLGNPGTKYEKTRHNVGFMIVEQFLKDFEPVGKTVWDNNGKFKSDIVELTWQPKHGHEEKVILVKPKTYMNNSGMAVKLATRYWSPQMRDPAAAGQLATSDIWIVHDDVDLPLGSMKIRFGGASAGHRGVNSIMEALKTDKFWRFRMGIGHPKQHVSGSKYYVSSMKGVDDYVLGIFIAQEKGKVKELIKHGAKALAKALEEGLEAAQNRFNTK